MATHLVKLIALAIGAFMILDTLPSSVRSLIHTIQESNSNPIFLFFGVFPTLVACLIAYLYFKYASKMELPTSDIGESLLYGGTKLFGLYFFIQGISRLLIAISIAMRPESMQESVLLYLFHAAIYLAVSFVLTKKTNWLLRYLGARDGA